MKAAFICRACHQRLQSRQSASSPRVLLQASRRTFTSEQQVYKAASTEPPHDNSSRTADLDREASRNGATGASAASRGSGSIEDNGPHREPARSRILGALIQTPATAPNPILRPRTRFKAVEGKAQHTKDRRNDPRSLPGKKPRPAAAQPEVPADPRIAKKAMMRYLQWGKIRHLYPEHELPAVKSAFRFWRTNISKLQLGQRPKGSWLKAGEWLYNKETAEDMRHAWEELSFEERRQIWPRVMMSTLYNKAGAARQVLSATLDPPPPGYAIPDVLLIIAKTLRIHDSNMHDSRAELDELSKLLTTLLKDFPQGHMPFRQETFGSLARVLRPHQAKTLYDMLKESHAVLHPNTALHFASKFAGGFASVEHKQVAFDILKSLANDGFDLNRVEARSVITSLLHCEMLPEESSSTPSEAASVFSPSQALQWLMEKGHVPNIITLTAFLDTLCQRHEVDEAIRIAGLFATSGLKLDEKAYAILIRGAKHSLDASKIQKTLELMKSNHAPSATSLSNALHAIYYFSMIETRSRHTDSGSHPNAFLPMLRIYTEKFNLQPLQSLIPESLPLLLMQERGPSEQGSPGYEHTLIPAVADFAASIKESHIQPDAAVLATMLRAYIKSLKRPFEAVVLYDYFKTRLADQTQKTNYAEQLVREKGTLVHDSFLLAIVSHSESMRRGLELFGDMLTSKLNPDKSTISHPAPSIFTFGVLLSGLVNNRQVGLASQILQVMKENGVEQNVTTWNMQVKLHAMMQDVPRTVQALQDMEASGIKPTESTFKAFGRLRNQDKALSMMEEIINYNQQTLKMQEKSS